MSWLDLLSPEHDPPPLDDGSPSPSSRSRPTATEARGRERRERRKGTTVDRFVVINSFADLAVARLDRAEIAVWLLLWRDTKPDGLARASQADLARRAGCNPRTVRRALDGLQGAGLVSVVRRGGFHKGLSIYRVWPLEKPDRTG